MIVLGATDRLSCIVSLSKFYSSGDPLFLGHSPSPAFSTNELFLVPTGFGAISRPIRCLQSNTPRSAPGKRAVLTVTDRAYLAKSMSVGATLNRHKFLAKSVSVGATLNRPKFLAKSVSVGATLNRHKFLAKSVSVGATLNRPKFLAKSVSVGATLNRPKLAAPARQGFIL